MADTLARSEYDFGGPVSGEADSPGVSPLLVDVPPISHGARGYMSSIPIDSQEGFHVAAPHEDMIGDEATDFDIYRGGRLSPTLVHVAVPEPPDVDEHSLASSSSSSSMNVGRRLGTLATVVEAAITRWARTHSSATTSSSSSSASNLSGSATTRTHVTRHRKGRRYSRFAFVHNAAHERAILARKKAREEFRVSSREFTLLLPVELVSGLSNLLPMSESGLRSAEARRQAKERRIIKTTSMPLILAQLDSALKKSAKWRRMQERTTFLDASSASTTNKGKNKRITTSSEGLTTRPLFTLPRAVEVPLSEKGWWLDVASPSWDDLRAIGKILRLHPLTLEDILHQDPREKLELFPGLGYYFVVFRALEGEQSRERFRRFKTQDSEGMANISSGPGDEGVIGAVNVYLVVFREGICSFHFEDISDHTEKLRNKVLDLEDTFHMTSDWIAHGLLDSIVDSFFPILFAIEKEVKEVDALVLETSPGSETRESTETARGVAGGSSTDFSPEKRCSSLSVFSPSEKSERLGRERTPLETSRHSLPLAVKVAEPFLPLLRRFKSAMRTFIWRRTAGKERRKVVEKEQSTPSTSKTLLRMAATRRLVTSLGRLLGTKGDVIAQIRKRLLTSSVEASNASLRSGVLDGGEVVIYMGDIQDHIVTLQQSLTHYERMLSHSHPAYLSQLRVSQSLAKGSTDKSILLLTVVSVAVLCIQVLVGVFSINVGEIPRNNITGNKYTWFYIILSLAVLIGCGVVTLVRYWQMKAKKKFSRQI